MYPHPPFLSSYILFLENYGNYIFTKLIVYMFIRPPYLPLYEPKLSILILKKLIIHNAYYISTPYIHRKKFIQQSDLFHRIIMKFVKQKDGNFPS